MRDNNPNYRRIIKSIPIIDGGIIVDTDLAQKIDTASWSSDLQLEHFESLQLEALDLNYADTYLEIQRVESPFVVNLSFSFKSTYSCISSASLHVAGDLLVYITPGNEHLEVSPLAYSTANYQLRSNCDLDVPEKYKFSFAKSIVKAALSSKVSKQLFKQSFSKDQ